MSTREQDSCRIHRYPTGIVHSSCAKAEIFSCAAITFMPKGDRTSLNAYQVSGGKREATLAEVHRCLGNLEGEGAGGRQR